MMVIDAGHFLLCFKCSYLEKFKNNPTMPIHPMFVLNFTRDGEEGTQSVGKGRDLRELCCHYSNSAPRCVRIFRKLKSHRLCTSA